MIEGSFGQPGWKDSDSNLGSYCLHDVFPMGKQLGKDSTSFLEVAACWKVQDISEK